MSRLPADPIPNVHKSRGGLRRIWRAFAYSRAGFVAAVRHEAAFRQELVLGVALLLLAPWVGTSAVQTAALLASVLLVWIVELLNSALEALADAITVEDHPLIGRAKDLGSAAVMLALLTVVVVWGAVIWQRWF